MFMATEMIGIITTNVVLVLAAVWRVSALLTKIETQLTNVNEKLSTHQSLTGIRLDAFEKRLLKLERGMPQGFFKGDQEE